MKAAQVQTQLKTDIIDQKTALQTTQAERKVLAKERKDIATRLVTLESKAKTLNQAQAKLEATAKKEREHARKVNNQKFARWVDNTAWAIRIYTHEARFLIAVLVGSFMFWPAVAALSVRIAFTDRCIQNDICRGAIKLVMEEPAPPPPKHVAKPAKAKQ